MILNRAKDYYENDKEKLRKQVRDKYRILFNEEKIKTESMEKIDIMICLKKRNKNQKNSKKITVRLKILNLIINKTINLNLIMYVMFFNHTIFKSIMFMSF